MTAGSRFFVDTNLLLYCLDGCDEEKRRAALEWRDCLWEAGAGRLSWQVLNEFYANATRKMGAPAPVIRKVVEQYAFWEPVGIGLGLLQSAWYWMDSAGLPYWDSLILAAAEAANCSYLLSEDFEPGRKFRHVTVVNPFASEPSMFGF
jgi:predicted nucleic acid-binding protein